MGLDPVLVALADCPVIEQKSYGGHIVFSPYPVISASNNLVLAHEICHKLSGAVPYNKFVTSSLVRPNKGFQYVLNFLLDWWDETNNSYYSMYLHERILKLHASIQIPKSFLLSKPVMDLYKLYLEGIKPTGFPQNIQNIEDLIVYTDKFWEECNNISRNLIIQLGEGGLENILLRDKFKHNLDNNTNLLGAGSDLVDEKKKGGFYIKTVSKYDYAINVVASLWKRNKYRWDPAYFGEISYKNLPGLLLGDQLGLPVYRLLRKLDINRRIFLVVDRSGSTTDYSTPIMETAIIITESFRRCNIPVSILDVGHTDTVINKINEPLDLDWFVPMSSGGTPLGEVCSLIKESFPNDYLLIITDGIPDRFDTLVSAINKFRGNNLTFVIGSSFRNYFQQLSGRALSVEPKTIIRELINDSTLA